MKHKAPYSTGYETTPIVDDYDCVTDHKTGNGQIVVHNNRICVYSERVGRKEQPVLDRLWNRTEEVIHPDFEEPCWLYDGLSKINEYQQIWYHGKFVRIHRLALILDGHTLTPRWHIDHLCERKNCWNTAHLEETTPGDNTRRYHAKRGR